MSSKLFRGLTALAALTIAATATPARASFMVTVTDVNSGQSVTITDNGAGDTDATVGQINYAPPTGTFTNYDIIGLTASSNRTDATATSGILTIGGTVLRTTATPASPVSLMVDATDTDYVQPAGTSFNLDSSASSTMTNTGGGDSLSFQSFGDDPNNAFGKTTPTGVLTFTDVRTPFLGTPKSFAGDAPTTAFAATLPYALTSRTIITVGPSRTTPPIALRRVQFDGTTSVTPATTIPEPASMVLLSLGGLGLFGASRRRKAKVAEA
jgi:hypothetical protein